MVVEVDHLEHRKVTLAALVVVLLVKMVFLLMIVKSNIVAEVDLELKVEEIISRDLHTVQEH